jgi:hypothetical protein
MSSTRDVNLLSRGVGVGDVTVEIAGAQRGEEGIESGVQLVAQRLPLPEGKDRARPEWWPFPGGAG